MVRIIDILLPGIEFCEPDLCNNAGIYLCGSMDIQSCNRFSFCHVWSLLLEGTLLSAAQRHPHLRSVKTPQVSFDGPGGKCSSAQLTIAKRVETLLEPVQVVVASFPPSHRYRVHCPGYLRFL